MSERILVIDDDPSLVHLMTENLQEQGYEVISGYDGDMAISMSSQEHPNLIVMDLNMPMTNGLKALESIRQNNTTREIPIILLTGEVSDKISPLVQETPRVLHLKKPFDLQELNTLVSQLLKKYPTPSA
jgi:DNA-binding response OmpR family regulator